MLPLLLTSADFQVFFEKDRKLCVLFYSTLTYLVLMGGKTYRDVDPSSVANLSWVDYL